MKFSSNSSPSSASYTTTNYDDNVYCSKHATASCINSILRHFLCFSNSLSAHPPDDFEEEAAIDCHPQENTQSNGDNGEASAATPGLVARLMGLDSMPMINCANLNSLRRTRSMDSLRDAELVRQKHRHVKSTLSFRDAPTFLEMENEDFFILSFESRGENKELRSKPKKSDLGFSEMRTKRSENKSRQSVEESDKENQETNQVSDKKLQGVLGHNNSKDPRTVISPIKNCHVNSNSPEIVKQQIKKPINNIETERGRLRKKKKDRNCSPGKKIVTECDSENKSPVSVLEFYELPIEFDVHSSVHKARLTTSNSRRTLFEELTNYNSSPSITNRIIGDREVKKFGDKYAEIWERSDKHSENYAEIWGEQCEFAETDAKQTKWMYRGVLDIEEFDDITTTFEFEILDQLVQELVDQV